MKLFEKTIGQKRKFWWGRFEVAAGGQVAHARQGERRRDAGVRGHQAEVDGVVDAVAVDVGLDGGLLGDGVACQQLLI